MAAVATRCCTAEDTKSAVPGDQSGKDNADVFIKLVTHSQVVYCQPPESSPDSKFHAFAPVQRRKERALHTKYTA